MIVVVLLIAAVALTVSFLQMIVWLYGLDIIERILCRKSEVLCNVTVLPQLY